MYIHDQYTLPNLDNKSSNILSPSSGVIGGGNSSPINQTSCGQISMIKQQARP